MFRTLKQQVADALDHESATGELASYVCGVFADQCGSDPSCSKRIETMTKLTVGFLRQYVQGTPMLLESIQRAAEDAGVLDDLMPVLTAAEDYFLQSVDFIPDHLGLAGVIDDSYLAQSLLQHLSDNHRQDTGEPLIPFDLSASNTLVRQMIGEPSATSLDAAIQEAIGLPDVQTARERLAKKVKALRMGVAGKLPTLATVEDLDLNLGALGHS